MKDGQKSVLSLAIALMWFSIYVYVPTLSTYAEGLGASDTLSGTILSAYGFVQMLFRLPIGIAADLTGRRKAFMLGGLEAAMAAGVSSISFAIRRCWCCAARFPGFAPRLGRRI